MPVASPVSASAEIAVPTNNATNGLTSDEARIGWKSLPKLYARHGAASFAPRADQILDPNTLDAGGGNSVGTGAWKICRSRDHCGAAGVNAALGFFQEVAPGNSRALKKRLALTASVRRDGFGKISGCRSGAR